MDHGPSDLVGRDRLLGALGAVVERVVAGERVTALIAGEPGIGKTALLRAAVELGVGRGARWAWGTCLDADGAPGYWPWSQALDGLVRDGAAASGIDALGDDIALVASIVPTIGGAPVGEATERDRLLAMDATCRFVEALAEERPLLLVLDDLQWADASSMALLGVVAASPRRVGLGLICAYRDSELSSPHRQELATLASRGEHLAVGGLDTEAVRRLVEHTTGERMSDDAAEAMHRRTAGHPFFVRELALLGADAEADGRRVPMAVSGAIEQRLERLPDATVAVLEASALVGLVVLPDVVAAATESSSAAVEAAARPAIDAGVLTVVGGELRLAHDLLRETLLARIDPERRIALHRDIGSALEARRQRGGAVAPAELARHFAAAVPADGPARAVRWSLEAASSDCASLAFGEAAGHLRRLRSALADAAVDLDVRSMVDVLLAEADALVRAGDSAAARDLLRRADDLALASGDGVLVARVALATAHLGARFAVRRDETIRQLEQALAFVAGHDDAVEARVAATLARELQHSVAEDRPRAGPLSEHALALGRRAGAAGDAGTLLEALLARHDVLWVPGAGEQRAEVAREIVAAAVRCDDQDRHAEGLLLLANALLEQGSSAFEAALESCFGVLDARPEPRHRYTALTRRACVALLRGRLDDGARLVDEARALGERIREPDTGNVFMSQQLELVRARGDAGELAAFAARAVAHWTGAPVHANAVAAGFLARAGDLDAAGRHVAAVVDLGTWRADRSYLWSVFVRELAHAAIALDNRDLCAQLLADLRPLAGSCGVNGAVVAFAGSHGHTAGLLAAAVGEPELSRLLLDQAAATYRRLGASGWLADVREPPTARPSVSAAMRRRGAVWLLAFAGRDATVPHTKGLGDIARLVAAPGTEIHALELMEAADRSGAIGDVADRNAVEAYRRRLADLDAEAEEAERDNDPERRARAELERQALLDELGRVTATGGQARQFANYPAERARKAVSGRVRDAIRKLDPQLPEMAAHLERTIVTGTYLRYRPDGTNWDVDLEGRTPAGTVEA